MAKTKISEFSSTPANNTDIDSINIAEGCAPSNINDAIRELMAQLKDFQIGSQGDSFNGPIGTTTAAAGAFTTLSASSTVTLSGGTANGVTYLNGSKVLTSGSALTFNGTSLGIGSSSYGDAGTITASIGVAGTTSGGLQLFASSAQEHFIQWGDATSGSGTYAGAIGYSHASDYMRFYVASAEQMRLTSTGLGIGTSSPSTKLTVYDATTPQVTFNNGTSTFIVGNNSGGNNHILYGTGAYPMIFYTNATEGMRLDSAGNLGLGVTPSAWNSGAKALQIGTTTTLFDAFNNTYFRNNAYYGASGDVYLTTDAATQYVQNSGQHQWFNAPSGTAGNAITFTQAMTLDSGGNLLVGTTSSGWTASNRNIIHVAGTSSSLIGIGSNSSTGTYLYTDNTDAILSNNATGSLRLNTSGTERARIDSSGNLLVGASSQASFFSAAAKMYVEMSGSDYITAFRSTNASPSGMAISYSTTPNAASNYFIDARDNTAQRFAVKSNGGIDNYSGNNTNLSDRREKTNFAPATSYLDKICAIPVQTFNYIDQNLEEDGGLTLGVVAQDVQAVAPELVMESDWSAEKDGSKMRLSIYQTDLQYALMKCIQEQQAIIESLKARLDAANL